MTTITRLGGGVPILGGGGASQSSLEWLGRATGGPGIPARRADWRGKADTASPSSSDDTGQAGITYSWLDNNFGALVVSGGRLTAAGGGEGRGYRDTDAGATVNRIGGRFTFKSSGFSTSDGSVLIALANQAITGSITTAFRIGVHVSISEAAWVIGKISNSTGSIVNTELASGNWSTLLTADGVTEYEVEAFVVGNTAYVKLPDGTVQTVTDSDIGSWIGNHGFHEVILNASTSHKPGWTQTWVDTAPITEIPSPDPVNTFLGVRGEIAYASATQSFSPVDSASFGSSAANVTGLAVTLPKLARPVWLELNLRQFFASDSTDKLGAFSIVSSGGGAAISSPFWVPGGSYVGFQAPLLRVRLPAGTGADTWQARVCTYSSPNTNFVINGNTQAMYLSATVA